MYIFHIDWHFVTWPFFPDWSHAERKVWWSARGDEKDQKRPQNVGDKETTSKIQVSHWHWSCLSRHLPRLLRIWCQEGKFGYKGKRMWSGKFILALTRTKIILFLFSRPRRVLMVAIYCAATEATQPGESWGQKDASASSTGVVTSSARSVNGKCKFPRVIRHVVIAGCWILEPVLFGLSARN